ncbi:MAG: MBOAT family O-acyltransferase [Planctomycetota bacterium]|jgi:alginate O-acetyltransferase complex protein AlgI
MVFSSTEFLFIFLPVVFLLYYSLPRKTHNVLLLSASLIFYAWGEPVFIGVMLLSVLVNYGLALGIGPIGRNPQHRKRFLVLMVVFNVGVLFLFKYSIFAVENLNALPLPIVGISFFTFKAMSYGIDVYRGIMPAQKRLTHVALYIAFFPQLMAGPIVRYHDIAEQIKQRRPTLEKTALGIRRFIVGLAKKLLIANTMAVVVDKIFSPAEHAVTLSAGDINFPLAWIATLAYCMQIYFDFSGYSDMAIGLGKMFGFDIKENFNYPYTASSIKDFWRRWHISLSTWFKAYLYIPLGGNRKGRARTLLNMWIVFLCAGFWHGAAWTFILWGMFHGLFLMLETTGIIDTKKFGLKALKHFYTLMVVAIGFTLFRSESITQAFCFIRNMFVGFKSSAQSAALLGQVLSPQVMLVFAVSIVAALPVGKDLYQKALNGKRALVWEHTGYALSFVLLILCVLNVSSSTYNPFIYFRF